MGSMSDLEFEVPASNTTNLAGGKAYEMSQKQVLAQLACTNCFNGTFYAASSENLKLAKNTALKLRSDPLFIAKTAIYARNKGYMKDMPAFLTVMLAGLDSKLFRKTFRKVINNGKMLRTFVKIARSGEAGKKYNLSSGSMRHALGEWFNNTSNLSLLNASVGTPSMRDILRMTRPTPASKEKAAMFAWLKGADFNRETRTFQTFGQDGKLIYEHSFDSLPNEVKNYENYKQFRDGDVPKIDFRLLDSLNLGKEQWTQIALNAPWNMTKKNLNTFARHGVFESQENTTFIAQKLQDKEILAKAHVFPYELLSAWRATSSNANIPAIIRDALQQAMENATENVPVFDGNVYVCIDTSGSMSSPVTGYKPGATTVVRCVDVAAMLAASILRKNKNAQVVPFSTHVHKHSLNARDSIVTNINRLTQLGGGGTDCASALRYLNAHSAMGNTVIFVSDYESWIENNRYSLGTGLMAEWKTYCSRNPNAKLICIDLTPNATAQVVERKNILQVGGFSDNVFNVIDSFIKYGFEEKNHWVAEIESISLDEKPVIVDYDDDDEEVES